MSQYHQAVNDLERRIRAGENVTEADIRSLLALRNTPDVAQTIARLIEEAEQARTRRGP